MITATWRLCGVCPLRHWADRHPASWLARLWHWHTGWCPGWRSYGRLEGKRG
jgi:hypothetical protein